MHLCADETTLNNPKHKRSYCNTVRLKQKIAAVYGVLFMDLPDVCRNLIFNPFIGVSSCDPKKRKNTPHNRILFPVSHKDSMSQNLVHTKNMCLVFLPCWPMRPRPRMSAAAL